MPIRRLDVAPAADSVLRCMVWLPFMNVCFVKPVSPGAFIQCSTRPLEDEDENTKCVMNSYHLPFCGLRSAHWVLSLPPDTPRSPAMIRESVPFGFAAPPDSRCSMYFSGLNAPSWTDGQATRARHGLEKLPPIVVDGSMYTAKR